MTYIPPVNGGRINATISGNTAGAGALVSTGTLTLAGGDNITLSQNGNAITISGGAGGGAGSNTLGISNLGNTSGTSGVISGSAIRMLYAGGNNITLSQSLNASSGTITISAANQTVQTQNLHNLTLSGNTAGGVAQVSSGTLTLAGGNNVTLSQNGNAITVSAANQTAQTQNLHNVTLSGNTAGVMAQVSSGTLTLAGGNNITLSQNGNAITISGGAGGAGGGIALANSQTTYTSGTANLVEAGGAITIASTTGQSFRVSVPQTSSLSATGAVSISANASTISIGAPAFSAGISNIGNTAGTSGTASNQIVFAGGNNITLSQSTAAGGHTITIAAGAGGGGAHTIDFYQNMDRGTTASLATANGTLMLQRLNQENDVFAGNLTANTLLLNMTANMTATSLSSSHTVFISIGIYSDNATALSLINSASTSWAIGAATGNTASYHGPRWISFVSSQWSSAPVFADGAEYVLGVLFRSSNYAPPLSYIGQNYMFSNQRSGYMGTSMATNTTLAHGNYWNAMYGTSTTALPTGITSNQVNRNNATAVFMPHVILNNRYSGTF